jgi:hypothetical protein
MIPHDSDLMRLLYQPPDALVTIDKLVQTSSHELPRYCKTAWYTLLNQKFGCSDHQSVLAVSRIGLESLITLDHAVKHLRPSDRFDAPNLELDNPAMGGEVDPITQSRCHRNLYNPT